MSQDNERYIPESQHLLLEEFWDDVADEAAELRERYELTLLPWMALALLAQIAAQTQRDE